MSTRFEIIPYQNNLKDKLGSSSDSDSATDIPSKQPNLNLIYFDNNSPNTLIFCHGGAWITNSAKDFIKFSKKFINLNIILLSYQLSTKPKTVIYPQAYLDIKLGLETIKTRKLLLNKQATLAGHSCGTHLILHTLQRYYTNHIPEIKRFIGLEGIYDLDSLVNSFPSYREWFLDYVFCRDNVPNAYKDLSCLGYFKNSMEFDNSANVAKECDNNHTYNKGLEYYLVYSLDDELIDSCQSDLMFKDLVGSRDGDGHASNVHTNAGDNNADNTDNTTTRPSKLKVCRIEGCFGGHDEMLMNDKVINLIETIASGNFC
jgi:alpha/beta hydrolase fold